MCFRFINACSVLLLSLPLVSAPLSASDAASLFNGKDLNGWKVPENNTWWTAHDGILSVKSGPKKKGNTLWTDKIYRDFDLSLDFRMGEGRIDTGVFLRTDHEQIQIGISSALKRDMTCSPYIPGKGYPVEAKGIKELLKPKDWNRMRMRVVGKHYTVYLNGQEVMQYESDSAIESGPIGLQLHGGRVMAVDFRNLSITEIPLRPQAEQKVTIEAVGDDRLRIEIDGDLFTEMGIKGFGKAILYPIMNADGKGMTRDYPVNKNGRKGEAHDHVHHQSLFVGHQGQNNVNFWHVSRPGNNIGHVDLERIIETRSGGDRALVRTFNLWKDNQGKVVCSDTRELKFGVVNGARFIDIELNMHASHGDLVFQAFKDGFIGIRTHPHLRLKANPKDGVHQVFGHAENSEGVKGKAIWGKHANWVHYWGKVEGSDAGLAILAHPDNPRNPTWWHARDYGMIAANPFGHIKDGSYGELVLASGKSLTLRYRFLFHDTTGDKANIAKQYKAYASEDAGVAIPLGGK